MKVLFVSNLYPNSTELSRGVFNSYQIRHLAKRCDVRVVAPIAWFPIRGRHAPKGLVPQKETLEGIQVYHPNHFYLPKVARPLNSSLYAAGIENTVNSIRKDFPFDIIFVNWSFPDACGVAKLAAQYKWPFVTSVSGSDVHIYLTYRFRSRQILHMLAQSQAITTRSQELKNMLVAYGVAASKVHAVYNGVDPSRFHPLPREQARRQLGWDIGQPVLLFVGRLSPEKGADDLLTAFAHARRYYALTSQLVIVGDGPQRSLLEKQAAHLGLAGHINWVGWKNPTEVGNYMNAADFLCLPSQNEGVANVVLESFACGVPVIATAVGGIPEIMTEETGVLASPRQPESFAAAMAKASRRPWDPTLIRQHAAHFSWDANAEHLHAILDRALADFSSPS